MRQIFALLSVVVVAASIAYAGDVKVKVIMTTGPQDKPVTSFTPDTPNLFAIFQTKGISAGDKVKGVLMAEDVGDAAPANTKVLEKTLTLDEDTDGGDFSFSKPTEGWPPGKYRFEVYVNDELATKAKFSIGSAKETKKAAKEAGVPNEKELRSMTDAAVTAFGDAVKDKDFSEFYLEIASVWKEQTSAEKLEEAFKDFYDKDIDLPAAIKGKKPVFEPAASIDSDGVMVVEGYYPTKPNRVVFRLKYMKEENDWKLVGINVNLTE